MLIRRSRILAQFEYSPRTPKRGRRDNTPPLTGRVSYEPIVKHERYRSGAAGEHASRTLSSRPNVPSSSCPSQRNVAGKIAFSHAPPMALGIPLVSVNTLPDRFRGIFQFPLFNAVQSKCFHSVYVSNDNIVLSSPTGSGKTAVLELAICALANELSQGSYKVIYQAPTKALCAERKRGTLPHASSQMIFFF